MALLTSVAPGAGTLRRTKAEPRRLLIISPHFPPVNAPDHQRVRMALPYLAEHGWQAEVLAVASRFVEAALDPELEETLPSDVPIHRTGAIPQEHTRRLGWGSLAPRAYGHFQEKGNALLARGRFNLVFFSTSQFGILPLGAYWLRRHGVPFVIDLQDEWVSSYYQDNPGSPRPGGRFKYALSQWRSRRQERAVIPQAARIISVSERYKVNLRRRHPSLPEERLHFLPFGAAETDFARLQKKRMPHYFFQAGKGTNWVYVGRGGPAMRHAAAAFFAATRRALDSGLLPGSDLRIHFIGTDYAVGSRARASFSPLACAYGLGSIVSESTDRVPHFTALQCLLDADALIVPGSDDPGYTASKIHAYVLARRPMLSIFHEQSSCVPVLRGLGAGTVATFATGEPREKLADLIFDTWFKHRGFAMNGQLELSRLEAYSASAMTRRLARVFDAACARTGGTA